MTATISRYGSSVASVFALLGLDENSATSAIGWALAKSSHFRAAMLQSFFPGSSVEVDGVRIELQRHGGDRGFTDIELIGPDLHLIIEAKRGFQLPNRLQLERYCVRLGEFKYRALGSLSASPNYYAKRLLPTEVRGVPVLHRSWRDIDSLVHSSARHATSPIEKLWLRELGRHLEDYVSTQRIRDNTVYVVSVGKEVIHPKSGYTFIDVVKDGFYFHPVGKGWPSEPPNYIGFRFDGRLQGVHHIREWQIPASLRDINPKWPRVSDHFLYTLGPQMLPAKEVKSGPIWQLRSYASIDLLLSGECGTLSEAFARTKKRLADG